MIDLKERSVCSEDPFSKVSLILPTLNNMPHIVEHLNAIEGILHRFGQVIAVDSYSDDGTFDVLSSKLPAGALVYQRERGLYQSWNDAISKASQPYCYISTIGDVPDSQKLEMFFNQVMRSGVELGISPPRRINETSGMLSDKEFAIGKLIKELDLASYTVCDREATELMQLVCVASDVNECLGGSFASNLCKTDFMIENPFPTGFSGAGDLVWTANACSKVCLGIYPDYVSNFLVHKRVYPNLDVDAARELFSEVVKKLPVSDFRQRSAIDGARKLLELRISIRQYKEQSPGLAKLAPPYLLLKLRKVLLKRKIKKTRADLLSYIAAVLNLKA